MINSSGELDGSGQKIITIQRQRRIGFALILSLTLMLVVGGGLWSGPVTAAKDTSLKVAMVGSIPVYYEEFGSGIPILMLHGQPLDHIQMVGDMEPIFKGQAGKGWRRIYPDLPGMGKTQGPALAPITTQDQVNELMGAFMQTVAPDQHFLVAGFSYGGYLARGMVNKFGSRMDGLLLWAPLIEPDPAKQHLPNRHVIVEDPKFLAALTPVELQIGIPLGWTVVQSLGILNWLRADFNPGFFGADFNYLNKLNQHFTFSFPVDQLAAPFPAPTLIMTGRQDIVVGYRDAGAILDNYPRGTYVVFDRAGHFLAYEQRAQFRSLTGEWLNRVKEFVGKNPSSDSEED